MNDRFGRELRKILDEEIERLTENLIMSAAAIDYPTYRSQVGQIQALKRVNERYLDEVESTLNKR